MRPMENPAGQGGALKETAAERAVSGIYSTASADRCISDEHAAELSASAVPREIADVAGVFTAYTVDQVPEGAEWVAHVDGALPALVYPMREIDGTETWQIKPQPGSVTTRDGRILKYVGPSKKSGVPSPQLVFVGTRRPDGTVSAAPADAKAAKTALIVEGCKQALAALSHAAEGVAVYRIAGVWSWRVAGDGDEPGGPTPYLPAVVRGKEVVILGDADAATNIAVFDGLTALGEEAKAAGAESVKFAVIPGKAKQGVDDVLAALDGDEARRSALAGWIAKAAAKPAALSKAQQDKMRKALRRKEAEREMRRTADPGRKDLDLVGDWHEDCLAIAEQMGTRLGGRVLFTRGGFAVELTRGKNGVALARLDTDGLHRRALEAVRLIADSPDGPVVVPGLKRDPLGVLKGRVLDVLPPVTRISSAPVVRADGSIVTTDGYDPETQVLVDLAPDVRGLTVPEHPTDDDVAAAVHLIRDELFELDGTDGYDGWVFADEVDRTHAIAFLLTALTRSAYSVAPLVVMNGLQRGVGKGEVVRIVYRIVHGVKATFGATPDSDVELEKRITADLIAGRSMVVLDEVMVNGKCRLDSPALTAALTAAVWGGRLLGKSEALTLEQSATWVATGNNVAIPGDMVRRVYAVRLSSDRPELDERGNFRRDLDTWVPEHRAELLTAVLTLIRAWYDRGQPEAPRPIGFVGFTEWQRVVGGILHNAGIHGFLSNVREMRENADSESADNNAHLEWVAGVAANLPGHPRFTAKEILAAAAANPDSVPPYDQRWGDLDPRALGKTWKGMAGRWFGDLRIVEDGSAHGNVRAWRVQQHNSAGSTGGGAGTGTPPPVAGPREITAVGAAPGEVIDFTDRRGHRQQAARAMPPMTGVTIAELGGGDPA